MNKLRNRSLVRDERGEGVISLAIGVLIMAFLGAAMWVAFQKTMDDTQKQVDTQVQKIGSN
jgi:uncharacterized membrane-anchored protein YhcB (DUF1043 family)